jgi:hypothetical protein
MAEHIGLPKPRVLFSPRECRIVVGSSDSSRQLLVEMRWCAESQDEGCLGVVMCLKLGKVKDLVYGYDKFVLASLVGVNGWKADVDFPATEIENHLDAATSSTVSSPLDKHVFWSKQDPEVDRFGTELLLIVSTILSSQCQIRRTVVSG